MLDWAGVVLCGGKSARFGSDKAFARIGGIPLVARSISTFQSLGSTVFLSVRADAPIYDPHVSHIVDDTPDQGPLSGIASVFRSTSHDRLFVLAVDLPCVSEEDISHLLARDHVGLGLSQAKQTAKVSSPSPAVSTPHKTNLKAQLTLSRDRATGQRQPLCGVWHRSIFRHLEAYLAEGHRSVMRFVDLHPVNWIDLDPGHLKNVNKKDDLGQIGA